MQLRKKRLKKFRVAEIRTPSFREAWVRAKECPKTVIAVVVSLLFHYCNPRSIACLNYYYQWPQFCRREMSRRDIACVACLPRAPFSFSPPSRTMTFFVGLLINTCPLALVEAKQKWHSVLLTAKFSKQSNKISLCKCKQELVMLKRSKC